MEAKKHLSSHWFEILGPENYFESSFIRECLPPFCRSNQSDLGVQLERSKNEDKELLDTECIQVKAWRLDFAFKTRPRCKTDCP